MAQNCFMAPLASVCGIESHDDDARSLPLHHTASHKSEERKTRRKSDELNQTAHAYNLISAAIR